jgi:hypothetical protein
MEYLRREDNYMVKYEITYDEEELDSLAKTILYKCGKRVHHSYASDYPNAGKYYENLEMTPIGEQEYWEETRTVYQVEYDEIKVPRLTELIHSLINYDQTDIIDFLFDDERVKDEEPDDGLTRIAKLNESLITLVTHKGFTDYDKAIDILNTIKEIDQQIKKNNDINACRIDENDYIPDIKKLIHIKEIGRMDYETYNSVIEFKKCRKK